MRASPKIAKTTKVLAIIILVVYIGFFAVNTLLQGVLDSNAFLRDQYIADIEGNADVDRQVREISNAVDLYKNVKSGKKEISDSLDDILEATQGKVEIISLNFNRKGNSYSLTTHANKASTYALLISKLLESEEVSSITLKNVIFEARNRSYSADFEMGIE